jgi:hypothetical protein
MGFFTGFAMSAFSPTYSTLEPPQRPDNLSSAVLHSLSRPIFGKVAWGVIPSFILGAITFGILPLISWPRRFGRFVVAEQQQFWHLVEWLRIRTGDEEAAKLRDSVRMTGATPTLWMVPAILLGIVAYQFMPIIAAGNFTPDRVFAWTYGAWPWPFGVLGLLDQPDQAPHLYKVWSVCLSIGFFSHWLHVRQHVANVNQLLRRLNLIFVRQHLPPVPLFGVGIGLRPLWLIAGIVGLAFGAVWAIPAALAGAVHQRYCKRTSTRIRSELAMRVHTLLHQQRPPLNVPMPNGFRIVCRNPLCGKTLPGGSAFCSRCGTSVPESDAVA